MTERIKKAEKNLDKAYEEVIRAKNREIMDRQRLLEAREYFIEKLGGKSGLYKLNQFGCQNRFNEVWGYIRKLAIVCAVGGDHYGSIQMCLTTDEKYEEATKIAKEFIDLFYERFSKNRGIK